MNHLSPERAFQVPGNAPLAPRQWLRAGALALSMILAAQATWILVPEIVRPSLAYFPTTPTEALDLAAHRSAAALAAEIGWPRGDLWTERAMTANATLLAASERGQASDVLAASNTAAETAATLAPTDARAWLVLAMVSARTHSANALVQLKMSYYTVPVSEFLFPLRIQVAAQLPRIDDQELQGFLQDELKVIIHDRPALKRSIVSAFRSATPAARHFFEATLAKLDAKLLAQLRSAT